MNIAKVCLLIANWALCAAGGIAVVVMLSHVAEHPLAKDDPWVMGVLFNLPYLILACVSLLSYSRTWMLVSLLFFAGLVAFFVTVACAVRTEQSLALLNAQAAGRHMMICGPPIDLFFLMIAYLISAMAFATALMLFTLQAVQFWQMLLRKESSGKNFIYDGCSC